ncbi:MAG TPA: DUF1549 domain-containing protein [Fimbriiglobus sp.]|nr:DUF1549 domain-containing protein [Fimbriiglobus sp.]
MRFLSSAALLGLVSVASAAEPTVSGLTAFPPTLTIRGADDAPQLLVTGQAKGGRQLDLTGSATYAVSDPAVARVDPSGRVYPLANGSAAITATAAGQTITVPVTVRGAEAARPINFANQVEPVLTKLGCNSGGCHGKIAGQNGFRLSLLGFDPELDYMTLVKESRGRRLFPAAPDQSLFLQKAAGVIPHGGGKKTDVGSEEYKLLRRWIATGMPYGSDADPTITKVTVYPDARVIDRQGRQQLVVHAHYSDGSVEDVTRRAKYESNETEVATVGESGLVQTLSMTGQAAVMVRFSGVVTVFRAVVPRPGPAPRFAFAPRTVVDVHAAKKWTQLGIAPSALCTDEQFVRRAYLDVTGTLPTAQEVAKFAADGDPAKRDKLIDRLVETPGYAYLFANKWADVLRVKRHNQPDRAPGTFAFHNWIREAIAADKPYDEFVRAIVCATGDETKSPPTVWFREVTTPEQFVDDVTQVFLGQRLACANCHHHPYEKWSQDDYWGLAAFYGRVGRKQNPVPGQVGGRRSQELVIFTRPSGSVTNKRSKKTAPLKPLGADPMEVAAGDDPRAALADWMTDPKNPFFARAVANRYWAHFFGRGIVEPLDDMRVTNPPSNPELLDALAKDLIDNGYSLKSLVKTICKSRTYQLAATPNEFNAADKQSFARYYPKRLPAEVVFDAVCRLTDSPANFAGLPRDRNAPRRALMLPDESFQSYFLDVLGRPQRVSACECERVNEASLAMTLHLLNSQEVQDRISRPGGLADRLARDPRPDDEKLTELFLAAVAERPTVDQLALARQHLAKHGKDKKVAYENFIWALINSKAFLFNQ